MKFYCDVCNTKYSIADEKVRGKVLKVRCKKCSNIITVREALAPVGDAEERSRAGGPPSVPKPPSPPPRKDEPPAQNWYFSINGQSSGPFDLSALRKRFASGELGDECYVWHEQLVDWKPVAQVDAFADALESGQEIKPRSKTLGFTGKVEAIKANEGPNKTREGAVPSSFQSRQAPTPERSNRPSVRNEKIDRLREKLKKERDDIPAKDDWNQSANTAQMTFAPGVEAAPPEGERDVPRSESAIPAFDLPPAGTDREDSTSSTSDILADEIRKPLPMGLGDDEPSSETPEDSGVIPFFPDAPKLESAAAPAPARSQTTTGSLLIQLQEIQKEGRGKVVWAAVGVALLLGGVAATAITVGIMNAGNDEPLVTNEPKKEDSPRELKERVYSSNKLNKFAELTLEDEVIKADEKVEDLEPLPEPEPAATAKPKAEPKAEKPAKATGDAKAKKPEIKAQAKPAEKESAKTEEAEPRKPLSAKERLLAYSKGGSRNTTIKRPEDQLATGGALPNTLEKEEARKGFRRIRRSVMVCRERFMRRGGRFETPKIKVSIVIQPTGRVSKYSTSPGTLAGTEFDQCMKSHMGRWRFAKWDGSPTEVSSSYILQ